MDFYTNVQQIKNNILVCGYRDGKRYKQTVPYKPYLFVPLNTQSETSEYKTLEGKPVKKVKFNSISQARQFTKKYKDVHGFSIYGLTRFVYPFINDNWSGTLEFDTEQMVMWYIDIETTNDGSFPDINKADQEVIAVTVRIKEKRIVLGLVDYTPDNRDITYIKFKTETELLQGLMRLFTSEEYRPDVITGWYIDLFDMPYLVNRITRILGYDEARKMSPWGILSERKLVIRNKEHTIYTPLGVSVLDYIDVYKKFNKNQLEEYNLAFVSRHEKVPVPKIDWKQRFKSMMEFYEKDPQGFITYNIVDVDSIYEIERQNRFLELVFTIAYDAKVNLNDGMTSVLLWDIITHNHLMEEKIVVPPQKSHHYDVSIPGGHVKNIIPGMYSDVVSLDYESLYPHLIMAYNISVETFLGVSDFTIEKALAGNKIVNATDLSGKVWQNVSMCGNGAFYDRSRHGIFPRLMEIQFKKRKEYKGLLAQAKKEDGVKSTTETKNRIIKYNNWQLAQKIKLNSAYGAMANPGFRYFSTTDSSAVTLSGQMSIMWVENGINKYLNTYFGTKDVDYVVASDTDSLYITLAALPKQEGLDRISQLDEFTNTKIYPEIKKLTSELAKNTNAYKDVLHMKRENIGDRALWRAKKNYVFNVWDKEGTRLEKPELKMMGIETVRSSTPEACRTKLKESLSIIMSSDENNMIDYITAFKKEFMELPLEKISFPRGINELSKYVNQEKSVPIHVAGAKLYNSLLVDRGLDKFYPIIYDTDKIKWVYLKTPNPTGLHVISFPGTLPAEFELDKYIDRELQFEKTYLSPIKSFLDIINWNTEHVSSLRSFF